MQSSTGGYSPWCSPGNFRVLRLMDLYLKYVPSKQGLRLVGIPDAVEQQEILAEHEKKKKKKNKEKVLKGEFKLKLKVGNPALRKLISGAVAGAVSRTAVAPFETIKTRLMVGSIGHSIVEVFHNIMKTDGWKGLFRGNLINVIRVAPSKAIELFAYDTVNKCLSPKPGEQPKFPVPASLVAGACARHCVHTHLSYSRPV